MLETKQIQRAALGLVVPRRAPMSILARDL
jgi:hypothetical protein